MHSPARHRHAATRETETAAVETKGLTLTGGWRYDLHGWFFDVCLFRGAGRKLRRRALALADLRPGEQALDVGCGTGALALEAARAVGSRGQVVGIDPSAEQIARASAKAQRRPFPATFQTGVIERLAFPDQRFDVVFSTLMWHHLPAPVKRQGLAEISRVLKPGGRLVIADFARKQDRTGLAARFHAGGSDLRNLSPLLQEAGFSAVEMEELTPPRFSAFPGAALVRAYK